ncbi:TIGR03089 family protein [Nesterenkonia sp. K-15-9-6]|uniref:TIGR03089 family protein n=1 Tax=Nesterenkonia sp. K-15-9-6 TaxID=3093918 RepID=UPI004044A89E
MAPLSLSTFSHEAPRDFPALFELLGARPRPSVVWYGPDGDRVELSGRVLQNWAVKLVGLLREEVELDDGADVLIHCAPHWKACAAVLAAGALGCRVTLGSPGGEPALVITDRPEDWTDTEALGDAELAALSPGLLDDSYADAVGTSLPGWVLDVSAEVRQHPDQLLSALPEVALPPVPSEPRDLLCSTAEGLHDVADAAAGWSTWTPVRWDDDAETALLGAWAQGRTAVLVQPGPEGIPAQQWETILRNEGVG